MGIIQSKPICIFKPKQKLCGINAQTSVKQSIKLTSSQISRGHLAPNFECPKDTLLQFLEAQKLLYNFFA